MYYYSGPLMNMCRIYLKRHNVLPTLESVANLGIEKIWDGRHTGCMYL